jgi:N-acetylglutamate synthase-like GNAT family acetyltransferase
MIITREAWPDEFERVLAFYKSEGYTPAISSSDAIVVAEDDKAICAAARLCPEHNKLVLRGMRVKTTMHRQGVGTQLLRALIPVIGDRECFVIAYRYLRSFFSEIGFVEVEPAAAPPFLADRYKGYRLDGGLDVIIMRRPSARAIREMMDANAETRPAMKKKSLDIHP